MRVRFGFGGIVMLLGMIFTSGGYSGLIMLLAAAIHELGHIVCARLLGLELSEMTLDFAGAKISVRGEATAYQQEFLLSISGAAANLLAVLLVLFVSAVSGNIERVFYIFGGINEPSGAEGVIYIFVMSSFAQAVVNLLPIRNFDGGQALSCVLSPCLGLRCSELIVNILSSVCAIGLWSISVYFLIRDGVGVGLFAFAVSLFFRLIECDQ